MNDPGVYRVDIICLELFGLTYKEARCMMTFTEDAIENNLYNQAAYETAYYVLWDWIIKEGERLE